jgi:hypothetical protein
MQRNRPIILKKVTWQTVQHGSVVIGDITEEKVKQAGSTNGE